MRRPILWTSIVEVPRIEPHYARLTSRPGKIGIKFECDLVCLVGKNTCITPALGHTFAHGVAVNAWYQKQSLVGSEFREDDLLRELLSEEIVLRLETFLHGVFLMVVVCMPGSSRVEDEGRRVSGECGE